jgi:signal peptidase I
VKYLRNRRVVKDAQDVLRHARHVRNMHEDILEASQLERLLELEQRLAEILQTRDIAEIKKVSSDAVECLGEITPKRSYPGLRENLEILAVAVVVAMGFRTYFIQPFKIPTGSMQPSLYGITSVDRAKPGLTDYYPIKPLKWFITGEWYRKIVVKKSGHLSQPTTGGPFYPNDLYYSIAGARYRVPKDACELGTWRIRSTGFGPGDMLPAGTVLWAGSRTAGDHVFVDKVRWNFLPPRRGEIMVFSTKNIASLPDNMHYIKRMVGLPNERISIDPPHLLADGVRVRKPKAIRRIADMDRDYKGYRCVEPYGILSSPEKEVPLGEHEYFALGDNTTNSRDGRYWGSVPEANLVGPAFAVYWPFSRIGDRGRWGLTCWR